MWLSLNCNQCCGSGMFIPDPDFYPSRIQDLGSQIQKQLQKRGVKKNVKHFFCSTNCTKCKKKLFLNCSRKKFGPNFKELWNFLPKKLSLISQKYEFGIRDPGSRGQKGTGSWIRIRNTEFNTSFLKVSIVCTRSGSSSVTRAST